MRLPLRSAIAALLAMAALVLPLCATAQMMDFPAERAAHPTRLTSLGPSPQRPQPGLVLPAGVRQVVYPSGSLALKGWLAMPRDGQGRHAAVVFLHGGFAFSRQDFDMTQPLRDAGYAVFCPWLRAENGNPGHFELMYGEVDDALAAIRWLRAQPGIDPGHVFLFGHSIGGGTAELTSLYPDRGVLLSGSAGGLYIPQNFTGWAAYAPFDATDRDEQAQRLLLVNLGAMRGPHIAYLGEQDRGPAYVAAVRRLSEPLRAPLTVVSIPGDHFTSVPGAMAAFIQAMKAQP